MYIGRHSGILSKSMKKWSFLDPKKPSAQTFYIRSRYRGLRDESGTIQWCFGRFANDINLVCLMGKKSSRNSYILHQITRGCAMRREVDPESFTVSHDPCVWLRGLSDRLIYLGNIQGNARFNKTAIMENHDPRQGNTILPCSHEF
jgi:hypothetical protein